MSPDSLGWMLLGDMIDAILGYEDEALERYKNEAELMRMQTVIIYNSIPGRSRAIRDPKELWRFGWEVEQKKEVEELSPEESAKRMRFLVNHFNNTDKTEIKE